MLWGLFENYTSTGESKHFKFAPIRFKTNSLIIFEKLNELLKNQNYQQYKPNKTYLDIYCFDRGFEVSYQIGQDEQGHATVNISVYGEGMRGRTRGKLKKVIAFLQEHLKDYLY